MKVFLSCKPLASVSFALLLGAATRVGARADDASHIQAVVTAALTTQNFSEPGVFADYSVAIEPPYARVEAGLGTSGNGSMSFALLRERGEWKILLEGGGMMGASEFIEVGIPERSALRLEASTCMTSYRPKSRVHERIVRRRLAVDVTRQARSNGPAILPRRTIRVAYLGRMRLVTIVEPLVSSVCYL